ncbi:NAD(P)/FAD-dependent oxidoreductase [Streptomyces sp. CC208A]|uniref:flavin monoamine oxidase family protein n=1 Tax=Streptomyces sp. CC208A TaxID=3044573 RepID=UPI0024A7BC07|nr:NAD(P)/FAD-dependent oxidoreductase [Streptomyces sp. CC208A]
MNTRDETAAGERGRGASRRSVVASAAAAAAALVGIGAAPEARATTPEQDSGQDHFHDRYDAIVVGAGFAGVTAARELAAAGARTLVLEARNRIGGRTWTDTFAGRRVEIGGTWVEPTIQPYVARELERYGIPLVADTPPERTFFPTPDGPREFGVEEGFGRMGEVYAPIFDGSREYFERPYEPLHRADLLRDLDGLSLRDRLDRMRLSPADELLVSGQTGTLSGGSSAEGALTALAQRWALAGWSNEGWNSTNSRRVENGTYRLLKAMLDDCPPALLLGSPVAAVDQYHGRAAVTTVSGRVFHAGTVVMAIPANMWRTIAFRPGLPRAQATASAQGLAVAHATKLWIHARGSAGRCYAQGAEGSPMSLLIPDQLLPDGSQLFIGFSVDPSFDATDRAAVRRAVRLLGPDIEVIDVRVQDWGNDRYARGGWTFRKPGQLTSLYPAVQQPHGRVVFAGSDIADGWSGYIDGAIESGFRAAGQALSL